MFRDDIVAITTADAGFTSLAGQRIYPDQVPETPTYPLVVYHAYIDSDNSQYRGMEGAAERTVTRVQFDCYGKRSRDAEELADALTAVWDGLQDKGRDIGRSFKATRLSDGYMQQTNSYRVLVDFLVEHGE